MKLLFIHPNFPGQFRHITTYLAKQVGTQVVGLGDYANVARQIGSTQGVVLRGYKMHRAGSVGIHHYLQKMEEHVLRGQAALQACLEMKRLGFYPDLICAHIGWGDALYLREVFPNAKIIGYLEFFYHTLGADTGFDPEFPVSLDNRCEIVTKNATQLLSLTNCDYGWSPTQWQANLYPAAYHPMIKVIHDGIDSNRIQSNQDALYTLPDGRVLSRNDEVLTLINRTMEPYRGFHVFMRALPDIQKCCPKAITLIVGSDNDVAYGNRPKGKESWRQTLLEELGSALDMERIYFVGQLEYEKYLQVLQVSRAHVYMTYPFVLSWSMIEAMAAECLIIGSNTAPVTEIIHDGENGLLFDFFDKVTLVDRIEDALRNPIRYKELRHNARRTVIDKYDLETICIPQQIKLILETLDK